jgi:hypothetical protein
MARLDFELDHADGVTTARLLSEFGEGVIERHWPGLHELEYSPDPARNPYHRYGVNNSNREEVVVYVGLAWAFTTSRHRFAIPSWDRDAAIHYLRRQDFDLVAWEYRVEAEEPAWPVRDQGFGVPLVSLGPDASQWQRAHEHEAALFPVQTLRDLSAFTTMILMDSSGSLNLFGVGGSKSRLVGALRGETRPALSSVLDPGDVFVDLTIGCDLGTYDSLLVVAPGDRRRQWDAIIAAYRERVAEYEAAVGSFQTFVDLFAALDALQRPLDGDPAAG